MRVIGLILAVAIGFWFLRAALAFVIPVGLALFWFVGSFFMPKNTNTAEWRKDE
jgi:hypothetical protein